MIQETKWAIDAANSEIAFKIKYLMISYVKGTFKKFDALVCTVGNDFSTAKIELSIDPSSIETGDKKRDEHLQKGDFFDVGNYKQITFKGDELSVSKDDYLELSGDFTIKGISKKIKLDVEFGGLVKDPWGNERAGFTVSGKINRKDWGLTWNANLEAGGTLIGDEVIISCEVQLIKTKKDNLLKEEQAIEDMLIVG